MNAKALLALIDECGMIELVNRSGRDSDGWIQETILRALRLLAAAEANDGTTPETDAFGIQPVSDLLISHVMRTQAHTELESLLQEWGKFARRLERERSGLAARVRELEAGGDLHAMMERMSK